MATPRKSGLAGLKATGPTPVPQETDSEPESSIPTSETGSSDRTSESHAEGSPDVVEQESQVSGEGATSRTSPGKAASPRQKVNKRKVTFYVRDEELERAKAAYQHTMGRTGIPSWTQYLEMAVREFTYKLEEEYNDRRPFS